MVWKLDLGLVATKFATENGDLGCLSNLPEWPNLVKVLVSVTALRCLFINNLGII